jgi:hypothetical protein
VESGETLEKESDWLKKKKANFESQNNAEISIPIMDSSFLLSFLYLYSQTR